MNLTQEEIKNILVLISRANITGQEATSVAILQQKLTGILTNTTVEDKTDLEKEIDSK